MKFDPSFVSKSGAHKLVAAAIVGLATLSAVGGAAYADPAHDNVANFNELSRQAEQLIETVQAAQLDLDKKVQLQTEAEEKHADDLAALDGAKAQLVPRQAA
ncbi:MAG: endopeptidase, partial [Mycobacterium sp.]